MIEINLLPSERRSNFTEFAGIKLNLINVKLLVPFFLSVYLIEPIIDTLYTGDIKSLEAKTISNNKKMRKLRAESTKYDSIKNQVKQLNNQEKELAEKIKIVKQIVDKRQNPFRVLKYITENIPQDVWLTELIIDDKTMKLVGYSKSWKSIGEFIENLKTSIFFNGNVNYSRPSGMDEKIGNNRVEGFEINTVVASFK